MRNAAHKSELEEPANFKEINDGKNGVCFHPTFSLSKLYLDIVVVVGTTTNSVAVSFIGSLASRQLK